MEEREDRMASLGDLLSWVCILMPCLYLLDLLFRKARKLPPGPVGFPVVGSLLALGREPHESLSRLCKLHGPLMTLRLGYMTTVVVSSAEMAEEILFRHDHAFAGRTIMDVSTVLDYNCHSLAFSQIGPRWRELRRICNSELFSPKRLNAQSVLRERKVRSLLRHVQAACVDGRPVDIGDCAFATALNLAADTLFSQDLVDLETEAAKGFKNLIWEILEIYTTPNLADYFPVLRTFDLQGLRRRNEVLVKQLFAVLDEFISKRSKTNDAAAVEESERNHDFLDVLLDLTRDPSSGFTRDNIKPLLAVNPLTDSSHPRWYSYFLFYKTFIQVGFLFSL